jgi:hypothetical protein
MKKTLQDQYLLIKEGKGHKGVFLADAKRDFPHIVPNAASFNEAVASLKTKNIISENVVGLSVVAGYEPKKKESYETAFEAFLAEAKKKENEDEKVKAEEKKVSKPVEKDLEKQYDKTDDKNIDNLIFDQVMTGYYAEAKDPKNADKTMQQLKDIVLKNLAKDPIYYTKDGQFGVKGLGYTTEAPGLGEPKEAKGKWKSSGYGDLKESKINEAYEPDINSMDELDLKSKLYSMGVTPIVVDSVLSTKGIEGLRDRLKDKLKDRAIGFKESKEIEDFKASVKKAFSEKPDKKFTPEEIEAKLNQLYPGRAERKKNDSPEESKLREVIREMIDAELGEATQLSTIITPKVSDKEREERDPQQFITTYLAASTEELMKKNQHLRVLRDPKNPEEIKGIAIRSRFIAPQNLKKLPYDINPMFKNFLNTANNIGGEISLPTKEGVMDKYTVLNNVNIGRDGRLSFKTPNPKFEKPVGESLMESVEKDLADINKEAEHEVLQSKLDKIDALIDHRRSKLTKLDEDEDMKALTDKKKVKELEKDIKKLEQARTKVEKMLGKTKGKKKEVIDETDDDMMDENMPLDDNMMGEEMSYEENY